MSRPESLQPLFRSLHAIKGVGDKLAALLTRYFGAPDGQEAIVLDVLMHMPSGVVDRRRQVGIAEAYLNQIVTLRLHIARHQPPPRGKPQWPPPASVANCTLRPATHLNMLEYWSRIRRLRRAEAAYAAKDHWKKLRTFVRWTTPIALYWQEITQKRLCAPGGVGRKRDFDAYQADGF